MFLNFDMGFRVISALFPIFFLLILGIILVSIITGIRQWHHNNASPLLRVEAKVVSKRTNITHHHHDTDMGMHMMVNTDYYVTFETDTGSRMEFHVSSSEYGMLAEGDQGKLSFQGTRFKEFERYL